MSDKPPLICPACNEPIWPTDRMYVRNPMEPDDAGELQPAAPYIAYHADCAPPEEPAADA